MRRSAKWIKKTALIQSTLFISILILAQTACASVNSPLSKKNDNSTNGSPVQTVTAQDGFYVNADHQMIVPFILSARHTLDIEIYQFTNPTVYSAIRTQMANGVRVRVIKEPTPAGDKCLVFSAPAPDEDAQCAEQRKLKQDILANGGTYIAFNKALCGTQMSAPGQPAPAQQSFVCFEHGKLIIADRSSALISTGNFNSSNLCDLSQAPSRCNRDFSVISRKPAVVNAFNRVFEADVRQVPYNIESIISSVPELTVSPESFSPLTAFIASAKTSIRIENQYLKFAPFNDAIIAAAARGVKVQVMVSSLCSFGQPSPADVNRASILFGSFDQAGIETRMFTAAIKIKGVNGYLHAKAIVVDDDRAWVGSVNGSNSALNLNREFGLFLDDAASVQALKQSFDGDFNHKGSETWLESTTCTKDYAVTAE